ncbi:MAG: DUF2721 domain-containing protein [Pseudomonadota bacterium]
MIDDVQTTGEIIQLSLAPVFLLVAIGSFINVATLRLGRVVDRARYLEEVVATTGPHALTDDHRTELRALAQRITSANAAIMCATFAALMACAVVATLFISGLMQVDASLLLAALFVATMAMLVTALGFFLSEILTATRTLKVHSFDAPIDRV